MKKLASIFLIVTVLVSTIGVSVNTHICKKEGVVKSYYVDFDECSCEAEVTHKCCHKPKEEKKTRKGCCQDESAFFQLNFDYTTQVEDVSLNPDLLFTAVLIYNVFTPLLVEGNSTKVEYNHYSSPIPDRDIPVLIQSFLI